MTERTLLKQTRVEAYGDDDDISVTSTQSDQYSSDQEFLVERVLAEKKETDGKLYFLILWAGYPEEKSTWEPKKNIQDPDILKVWKERKGLEARGLKRRFDLASFDARCQELADGKAARHRRRRHKRQRLGIPVSPSDSDKQRREDDSDSNEAVEINEEPSDDPGIKTKTKAHQKPKSSTKLFVHNDSSADEGPSKKQKSKGKYRNQSGDTGAGDDSVTEVIQRKAEQKQAAGEKKKAPVPLKGKPDGQKPSKTSETRDKPATQKPSHKPAPLRSLSESSEDIPLAEHRRQELQRIESTDSARHKRRPSLPLPTALAMVADRPRLAISSTSTLQTALTETSGQSTDINPPVSGTGRGKGAMRGGALLGPKNVFASSGTIKKRPTFIENAMDQSRDQKLFSNMHQRRKVQLAGREVADLAPDLAALGGLFDPSRPSTFQSLKPASFRRASLPTTNQQELDSRRPLDDLFGSSPPRTSLEREEVWEPNPDFTSLGAPSNSSAPALSPSRPARLEHDRHNEICYFWYTKGTCKKGEECRFIHSDTADLPIAPTPKGYSAPLPRPSAVVSEQRRESDVLQNSPISPKPSQSVLSAPTQSRPLWQERNPYEAICYFWYTTGSCNRGRACKYFHSESNTLPITPAPKSRSEQKSQTCKFWLIGDCYKSAEDCQYHHGPAELLKPQHDDDQSTTQLEPSGPPLSTRDEAINMPTGQRKSVAFALDEPIAFSDEPESYMSMDLPPPRESNEVCRWWQTGYCRNGNQCHFAHDEPERESVNKWTPHDTPANTNFQQVLGKKIATNNSALASQNVTSGAKPLVPQSLNNKTILENVNTSPPYSYKPETASLKSKPTKLSMDNYLRNNTLKKLGSRAKEVTFGKEETRPVAIDFGDFEQQKQQLWGKSFSALTKLHFTQTCSAQDFSAQQGLLIRHAFWQGSLDAADPKDLEALQALERVGEELRLRSAGLISVCADLTIIVYPAIEEWKFMEGSPGLSYEGRLRYLIFQTYLDIGTSLEHSITGNNGAYRKTLTKAVHGLNFKTFVPKPQKDKPYYFYLLFPSTANQTANFIVSWLRASSNQCKIYSSQTEGAWDFFTKSTAVEIGIVMVHESAITHLCDLPSLLTMIVPPTPSKTISFWYISNSISPYPLFPPPEGSTIGQITATRLLPHGHAFFLTPSFLISEPCKAYILLKWFKGRFAKATTGTWKLLCCHNVRQYLLDLALEKSSERDEMERKYLGEIRKDAIIKEKGLGYTACEDRFKLHGIVAEMVSRPVSDNFSDYDSDMPDEAVSPIIYADDSIDPDDEQALVTWFAGWSMFKLNQFRKFTVVGTSPEAKKRAVRRKQFTTHETVNPLEGQIKDSMTTNPFVIPKTSVHSDGRQAATTESPANGRKRQALAVAARLNASVAQPNASVSTSSLSTAKGEETNGVEPKKLSSVLEPFGSLNTAKPMGETTGVLKRHRVTLPDTAGVSSEPDLAMDIDITSKTEAPAPKHGISSKATTETLHFITMTGSDSETARRFLSKSNNDVQRAVQMFTTETTSIPNLDGSVDDIMDIDAQVIDLISSSKSSDSHQVPRVAIDDVARAITLYSSSNKLSPLTDDVVFSPPLNDANIFSPPQNDGAADERPRSSASGDSGGSENSRQSSRARPQTGQDGRRFVPTSVKPNEAVRLEQTVRQGFVPDADFDAYKNTRAASGMPLFEVVPRNGSAGASASASASASADTSRRGSPANFRTREEYADRMDVDSPMAERSRPTSAMGGNGGWKNARKEMVETKEIHFEATTTWYGHQKAEGKAWQHIYVDSWDQTFKYLGVK